jgi:hypothetical protein
LESLEKGYPIWVEWDGGLQRVWSAFPVSAVVLVALKKSENLTAVVAGEN